MDAMERLALDGAMFSVWLHGRWRWLTTQMTTEEKEAAAAAVTRFHAHLCALDGDDEQLDDAGLRWWRS